MFDDLTSAFEALERRAAEEPRLERYRVAGMGAEALDVLPQGWVVSDSISQIATRGGWWPGERQLGVFMPSDFVRLYLTGEEAPRRDASVRWIGVGTIWERDGFHSPALREHAPSAPLFGTSSQALWTSMVFPTEVALLEAFIVTYDELGLDDYGEVNPFFVEWITQPPAEHEPPAASVVHQRLKELSKQWRTDHPCWVADRMPRLSADDWPPELVATVLGHRTSSQLSRRDHRSHAIGRLSSDLFAESLACDSSIR